MGFEKSINIFKIKEHANYNSHIASENYAIFI